MTSTSTAFGPRSRELSRATRSSCGETHGSRHPPPTSSTRSCCSLNVIGSREQVCGRRSHVAIDDTIAAQLLDYLAASDEEMLALRTKLELAMRALDMMLSIDEAPPKADVEEWNAIV